MMAASYEAVFRLLFLLAAEHTEEGNYNAKTGWMLVEATLGENGKVTPVDSSRFDFVHEDLLTADPTGLEGQDLFG